MNVYLIEDGLESRYSTVTSIAKGNIYNSAEEATAKAVELYSPSNDPFIVSFNLVTREVETIGTAYELF